MYSCACPSGNTRSALTFCAALIRRLPRLSCVLSRPFRLVRASIQLFGRMFSGYDGTNCETDVDECALYNYPCTNGAECVVSHALTVMRYSTRSNDEYLLRLCMLQDLVNDFECNCPPGWEGKQCDANVDDCAIHDCVNGDCVDGLALPSLVDFSAHCTSSWLALVQRRCNFLSQHQHLHCTCSQFHREQYLYVRLRRWLDGRVLQHGLFTALRITCIDEHIAHSSQTFVGVVRMCQNVPHRPVSRTVSASKA
jgi:hypothetical protein